MPSRTADRAPRSIASLRSPVTLAVRMVRARACGPEDKLSTPVLAVISGTLWKRRFEGDEGIRGRAVARNGRPATIVGIAAPDFHGAWMGERADIWMPIAAYH